MGTKYSSQSIVGYNSSPPADDGSTTAANKITWAGIKTKLADTLNTFIAAVNTQLVTALDYSITTQSTNYTTVAADHQKPITVTGTTTISLGDATTMAIGYQSTIVNNGTGVVTIGVANVADTLDGVTNGTDSLSPGQSATYAVNATHSGYRRVSGGNEVPTGSLMPFAGSSAPGGWLLCYGQAVSRTTYAELFTAISTTYGTGDGSTTFNLPDLRGRSIFGVDNMGGSAANRVTSGNSGITGTTLGAAGGDERLHQHTHTATVTDTGHTHNIGYTASSTSAGAGGWTPSGASTFTTTSSTTGVSVANSNAGAGSSQNMPPAMMMNWIIRH